jgi:PTH1 family peptidyl-tRNA hydrolase
VGFTVVKQIARSWNVKLRKKKFLAKTAEVERENGKVLLALPQTYMNRSGYSTREILDGTGINLEQLVVIYDDLDIPLGEIRIRKEGGPGTHKGMDSIIQEIQTTAFPRIRIGIGPLAPDWDAAEFVLSPFEEEEKKLLEQSLKKAENALELILAGEIEKAMNSYNQKGLA